MGNLEWEGNALIDTGVARTAIPTSIARELGLEKLRDVEVTTATGTARAWLAYVEVELMGDRTIDRAVVLDGLEHVLIGVLTLESLDLKVDPRTGVLERSRVFVM